MKMFIIVLSLIGFLSPTFAEETVVEKAEVGANKVKRTVKKGLNRTKEAMCGQLTGDSKLECLAKKSKNTIQEGADVVKDKASEVKNAVDSDKK